MLSKTQTSLGEFILQVCLECTPSSGVFLWLNRLQRPTRFRGNTMKDILSTGMHRRKLLKAGGTLALFAAAKSAFPGGAFAAAAGPETTKATLGFIALTDSAPLIVAKEKGLFAKYGMPDVEVVKQASWGTTRDNLVLGSAGNGIDGAHILTPMPYLISTGKVTQNNQPLPMVILARLNLDAQAISVGPPMRI